MAIRTAKAQWDGNLPQGRGTMSFGSGAWSGAYSFQSRFEEGAGTNPEELIAAAHAGCFSMALSSALAQAGHTPVRVHTTATVAMDKVSDKMSIVGIELVTEAEVPGIAAADFQKIAAATKDGCIVSRALASVPMTLTATLK